MKNSDIFLGAVYLSPILFPLMIGGLMGFSSFTIAGLVYLSVYTLARTEIYLDKIHDQLRRLEE